MLLDNNSLDFLLYFLNVALMNAHLTLIDVYTSLRLINFTHALSASLSFYENCKKSLEIKNSSVLVEVYLYMTQRTCKLCQANVQLTLASFFNDY